MALVDPYDSCPCGSGKKYKWCCAKAEPYLERSIRLEDTAQGEAVLAPIEEGLAKLPGNTMLLLRKGTYLAAQQRDEEAIKALEMILAKEPANPATLDALARILLPKQGASALVARLQDALRAADAGARSRLGELALMLGEVLVRQAEFAAGFKHIELAAEITDRKEDLALEAKQLLAEYRRAASIHPWFKEPLSLSPAPSGLDAAQAETFNRAIGWAKDGLWDAAAAAFELLSGDPDAGRVADRNLGICRLWLAEGAAAAAALRRAIAGAPPTTDTVDLAVLLELVDPTPDPEQVEQVSLTWPIRDRHDLLARLGNSPFVAEDLEAVEGRDDHEDYGDYILLDRPIVEDTTGLTPDRLPVTQAEITVAEDTVKLVTYDDGRLNAIMDQFTAIAGTSVPPSHPKTKVTRRVNRSELATAWQCYLPPDVSDAEQKRLSIEKLKSFIDGQWADVPQAVFSGKTPAQLAKAGGNEVLLRAAVLILQSEHSDAPIGWASLRSRLNIPAEPTFDPASVVIADVPVARLRFVPVEGLDDDRLVQLERRASAHGLIETTVACCKEIVRRGTPISEKKTLAIVAYTPLIGEAVRNGDRDAAFRLLEEGRAASKSADAAASQSSWDLSHFQLAVRFDPPETWVPLLVELTERYKDDRDFTQVMSSLLIQMGLLRPVPLRDRPGEFGMDTRLLERLIGLYGPKVQTASDYLGISATKGGIWTPGSENKGGGAIWTPGSDNPGPEQGGDKPRIILAR